MPCGVVYGKCRATEMDVTMIGLQNAGKSSLLRVLAVGCFFFIYPQEMIRMADGCAYRTREPSLL